MGVRPAVLHKTLLVLNNRDHNLWSGSVLWLWRVLPVVLRGASLAFQLNGQPLP